MSPCACASAQIAAGTPPDAAAAPTLASTSAADFIPITTFDTTDGNAANATATLSTELIARTREKRDGERERERERRQRNTQQRMNHRVSRCRTDRAHGPHT